MEKGCANFVLDFCQISGRIVERRSKDLVLTDRYSEYDPSHHGYNVEIGRAHV